MKEVVGDEVGGGGAAFPVERRWEFARRQAQKRQKGSGG